MTLLVLVPLLLAAKEDHFEAKVRPVLAKQCLGCHAASKQSG